MSGSVLVGLTVAMAGLAYAVAWLNHWDTNLYHLPLLMIITVVLANFYGGRGLLLALWVVVLLEIWVAQPQFLAWHLSVLFFSGTLAFWLGQQLRWAQDRLRTERSQIALLVDALDRLSQLENRESIFRALLDLDARLEAQVGLWLRHQGLLVKAKGSAESIEASPTALAQVFEQGRIVEQNHSLGQQLFLPLRESGVVVAAVGLQRQRAFGPTERQSLERFVRVIGESLTTLAERSEAVLLSRLAGVANAHSSRDVAERTLVLLLSDMQLYSASMLVQRGDALQPLAIHGQQNPQEREALQRGLPFFRETAWEVYQTQQPIYLESYRDHSKALALPSDALDESAAFIPLAMGWSGRSRVLLRLKAEPGRVWYPTERELLGRLAQPVGLALESALQREALERMLSLIRQAVESPSNQVYQNILEAAVQTVPGAQAGSLIIRESQGFVYRAAVGFSLTELMHYTTTDESNLVWYGEGIEKWRNGVPRILSNQHTSLIQATSLPYALTGENAANVAAIETNLCVPIVYRGEVLALLNLDNLYDPGAFDEDSIEMAQLFSAPVGALLRELNHRERMEQAALTDPLTALLNRRAFDHQIAKALTQASQTGQPLSLLVMDLRGFKRVNDQLGHEKGDVALRYVAQELSTQLRRQDQLFRWGGDEFAALLPNTGGEAAQRVAARYAEAIGQIRIGGLGLGVNIGVSVFPDDGTTANALLRSADARMYAAKEQDSRYVP